MADDDYPSSSLDYGGTQDPNPNETLQQRNERLQRTIGDTETSDSITPDPVGNALIDTVATAGAAPLLSKVSELAAPAGEALLGDESGVLRLSGPSRKIGSPDWKSTFSQPQEVAGSVPTAVEQTGAKSPQQLANQAKTMQQQKLGTSQAQAPGGARKHYAMGTPQGGASNNSETPNSSPGPNDVHVFDPQGNLGLLDQSELANATAQGYRQATPDDLNQYDLQQNFGGVGQQVEAGLEGTASGLIGATPTAMAERALGVKASHIQGRAEANPITHGVGEAVGLVAPSLATFGASGEARAALQGASAFTQAGALERAGSAVARTLGIGGEGSGLISKIGSKAVSGAVENALYAANDVGSKIVLGQDPGEAIENAVPYLGASAVLGGVLGGGLGSVPELWKAASGTDTGGILKAVTDKLGGKESSVISDPVSQALETMGVTPKPEVIAALSNDPATQAMAKALEQSDATSSGQAYQESLKDFHSQTQNAIANSLGKTPELLASLPELSRYDAGKTLGNTLADEYEEQLDPIIKEFETLKDKYKNAPLNPDSVIKGGKDPYSLTPRTIPDIKIPGTASTIADNLGKLANQEGWIGGDRDIQRELNRVLKALPTKSTLSELTELGSQIGKNTKSTLPFGMQTALSRAGAMMRNVLRDAEDGLATQHLGNEAPDLVNRFNSARQAYKAQAALKEALDDRLKIGGSVSGFTKGLRGMAQTDGESVIRRLSGSNDADLLNFLGKNFPKTAQALKDYHMGILLDTAVNKAKPGETLSIKALQSAIDKMSPELKNFVIPQELSSKLEGMSILNDQLDRVPHNFSNTARAMGVMNKYGISSAMGMLSMLTGHGAVASIGASQLAHTLSKTAPDAVRLSLLKFLGSNKPINSAGFAAMADLLHNTMKGESIIAKSVKGIFNVGSKVIPDSMIPDAASRAKLDKKAQAFSDNPEAQMRQGGDLAHYLPEHSTAVAQMSGNVVNYINSQRPGTTQASPLDTKQGPTPLQTAKFNRTLDIAEQPLSVMNHIAKGTLNPDDVKDLHAMYPNLYNKLANDITKEMVNQANKGAAIPYKTRISMSLFMAQPMDSTMNQMSIAAAQPVQSNAQSAQQPAPQPKKSSNSLNKLPNQYQTTGQSRESRQNKS